MGVGFGLAGRDMAMADFQWHAIRQFPLIDMRIKRSLLKLRREKKWTTSAKTVRASILVISKS